MIRCHLSRLMGEHKMKIADVARATGLNRNTVTLLYKESASRVELDAIEKLCRLFGCEVGDLFEITHNEDVAGASRQPGTQAKSYNKKMS